MQVAIYIVGLHIKVDDGQLAGRDGIVEQTEGVVHQRHIVGLHRLTQLLHLVELALYLGFHLQAGIVALQVRTQRLGFRNFQFLTVGKQRKTASYQETVTLLSHRGIPSVAHFQFRQPILLVYLHFFRSGLSCCLSHLQIDIRLHHFVIQRLIIPDSFNLRIIRFRKFQWHIAVHGQ